MKKVSLNRLLIASGAIALMFGFYFFAWWQGKEITIRAEQTPSLSGTDSGFTGESCTAKTQRPIAIMLASDPVARPLSGIASADLVVEMPVTPGPDGVTRMMAVYQCQEPLEIGSVRSARAPFIPLVAGFGAFYAHWGGESDALEQLSTGVLDSINALKYEGSTFLRKKGIRPPHNGFTTLSLLRERAQSLGYSLKNTFSGYVHRGYSTKRNVSSITETITIPYDPPYDVRWEYDAEIKRYKRFRGGTPEVDKLTGTQVSAGVVIVLETIAEPLRDQYLTVSTTGQGTAMIYQEGMRVNAVWKKDPVKLDSKLMFTDTAGKEISFVPGPMWIEITAQ